MRVRRIIEHIRQQHWTAIGIDLVIVVFGVFIGMQVSNWNQARVERAAYEAAVARLAAEIDVNLRGLDAFDLEMAKDLAVGSDGLDALQSCVDTDTNRRVVDEGLDRIRGTANLHPHRSALDEITSNPSLLEQQTPAERQRFAELLYYFDVLQKTADASERRPEESGMELNPLLRVGASYRSVGQYYGSEWVSKRRKLELAVPVARACHDNLLLKSFFNWERIQRNLPLISQKWRAELVATKALIGARR